ncbi:hypothetical protein PUN28_004708 [Cardiocondyla obscurior]|uniref:Uncharacterized protein n=1 Tax=Cardiocondyla obscurior TaxID=286306 RepID=A0AAW2GE17_9HYME
MRTNATSGPVFSLYISIVLLVILISVSDKTHAKRGCASFGHSCFGAHGKRFDSTVQHLEKNPSIQESDVPSLNNGLPYFFSDNEFRERPDQSFMRSRKDTQPFDVYPLSSLVDRWMASHRRLHRTDTDITNK